jgi:hypothetical protein
MFLRKMTKWQTLATGGSPVSTSVIPETRVTILSSLQTHYVALNSTATSTSIVIPEGVAIDFEIPNGSTISALAHSGQGHITILYY